MVTLLNYRLRIVTLDGRTLIGQMLAFDKHMNMVLADCEEFRKIKQKIKGQPEREEKRVLGLIILRGETIVSLSVEAPPPPSDEQKAKAASMLAGPGVGRPMGRGLPVAPPMGAPIGLAGPVRGIGGPGAGMMAPQAPYGRGAPMPGPPFLGRGGPMPPMGAMPFPGMPPPGFRPNMQMPGAPPARPPFQPPSFRPPQ
ncbi:hypothetical protein SmJEL517_g00112 [Synchytrium microbalum]|uniref:Sm protein B n=1 Tax=Synchytrium microbalum TaxID=1806994 RepID=A0A507CB89_9FUNG|nr:uncharacterized protein SmJEL517_g00112 [Synchytrium microbalum]TPX38327.1 hypothetical protein SmJEL517_g00112 [Synchytrium microbalum]